MDFFFSRESRAKEFCSVSGGRGIVLGAGLGSFGSFEAIDLGC